MIPISIIDVNDKKLTVTHMRTLCADLKQFKYNCFNNTKIILNKLSKEELKNLLNCVINETNKTLNELISEYNNRIKLVSNNLLLSILSSKSVSELRTLMYRKFKISNSHTLSKSDLIKELNILIINEYGNNLSKEELNEQIFNIDSKKIPELKKSKIIREPKQNDANSIINELYEMMVNMSAVISETRTSLENDPDSVFIHMNKILNSFEDPLLINKNVVKQYLSQ